MKPNDAFRVIQKAFRSRSKDAFELRPLPFENVFFYRKVIDNSRLAPRRPAMVFASFFLTDGRAKVPIYLVVLLLGVPLGFIAETVFSLSESAASGLVVAFTAVAMLVCPFVRAQLRKKPSDMSFSR